MARAGETSICGSFASCVMFLTSISRRLSARCSQASTIPEDTSAFMLNTSQTCPVEIFPGIILVKIIPGISTVSAKSKFDPSIAGFFLQTHRPYRYYTSRSIGCHSGLSNLTLLVSMLPLRMLSGGYLLLRYGMSTPLLSG